MKRLRADELLIRRGLASDVHEATALIMADKVRSGRDDSIVIDKPGMIVADNAPLSVKDEKRYVSRGGYKLAGALDGFDLDVCGMRCIDLGASTGGFTDCLLQRGAASVLAVDVGYGQLAERLRSDARVRILDRTNIREMDPISIGAPFDLVVADLSFISIAKVADVIAQLVDDTGRCVLLVKPQFEARREEVGEGGIVRDPAVHSRALERAVASLADVGLITAAIMVSPIKGAGGNTEFLLLCGRSDQPHGRLIDEVSRLVSDTDILLT
jgi:23S rRNA (cytidine1920-2'-O)/16S rRNA (cytidine1409-2'-O)-methyltransferase